MVINTNDNVGSKDLGMLRNRNEIKYEINKITTTIPTEMYGNAVSVV